MDTAPPLLAVSGREIIDSIREGIIITDAEGLIQAVNTCFCSLTGFSPEDVIGQNPRIFKSGKHTKSFYDRMWKTIADRGFWKGEIWNRRKDGSIYLESRTISAIRDNEGTITNYIGIFSDISKQKKAEETIRHLAFYDPLTNLPNRALFRDRLKQAINQAERNKKLLAVLFLDLDRVKIINDTLGHDIGDRLLVGVARRLEECLREGDSIARLGGDEFIVLLPGVNQMDDVVKLTEKILGSLKPAFNLDGHELFITASVGISIYPHDGEDANTLLRNADSALYRAKGQGRNNYQLFTRGMETEVLEQLELTNSLRRALDRDEFVVYYQPQLNIESGEIVGIEALVRWQHPEFGVLPPKRFIHWAEDTGLIIPLGEWVLKQACEQNRKWQMAGHPRLRVAVNLSALQFRQKNLVSTVEKVLADTNLPPDSLELELTETVIMENAGPSTSVPHSLRALGVRFSIDDFGTGYSSLSYLKRFPVNTLKMDRSFIQDLTTSTDDLAIATAVVTLGHGLNLTVLAEGVETEGQLETLKNLKCDRMQGFLFSEPIPASDFEEMLNENRRLDEATLFSAHHKHIPNLTN